MCAVDQKWPSLLELAAIELAEDILSLRDVEDRHARLRALESPYVTKMLPRLGDAREKAGVSERAYRFAREAPIGVAANHKFSLPYMRGQKMHNGATLEGLSERLGLPEATLLEIEDGGKVSLRLGAKIAQALLCEISDMVLDPGQTLADYWKEL